MWSLLSNWIGWLGLGTALATAGSLIAGISWLPGMSVILPILTSALQMISPIVNAALSGLFWIWSNILWPGLLDIMDSWATIFTVIIMGSFLWFGLASRYEVQHIKDRHVIAKCVAPQNVDNNEAELDLPWPFKWK